MALHYYLFILFLHTQFYILFSALLLNYSFILFIALIIYYTSSLALLFLTHSRLHTVLHIPVVFLVLPGPMLV